MPCLPHFARKEDAGNPNIQLAAARETCRTIPVFGPEDVVIHNRCAGDVWFWHSEYGPACFSLYSGFPRNMTGAFVLAAPQSSGSD